MSSEERLLRAIFGEKAKDVRDTSQRMNNAGGGKVVGVKIFSRENGHELKAGVLMQSRSSLRNYERLALAIRWLDASATRVLWRKFFLLKICHS